MNIEVVFASLAVVSVLWSVVTSVRIVLALRRRGVKVSFLWLRIMIIKYVRQYKRITLEETGHAGPLYYHWIISISLAWVFAFATILLNFSYG